MPACPPPPAVSLQPGTSDSELTRALLLSGLPGAARSPCSGVAATKPNWETGTKAAISLTSGGGRPRPLDKGGVWSLALDGESGEDELVDDEALLTEEDKLRPAPPGGQPRRACLASCPGCAAVEALQLRECRSVLTGHGAARGRPQTGSRGWMRLSAICRRTVHGMHMACMRL